MGTQHACQNTYIQNFSSETSFHAFFAQFA